jgi:hypothetical protein
MSFLQLPAAELETSLSKELARNPALELVDEPRCPGCGKRLLQRPCPTCAAPGPTDHPIVYLSPREPRTYSPADMETEYRDAYARVPLDEYIFRQIGPHLTRAERPVAAYILAQLDDDGLFTGAPAEVAESQRVALGTVDRILRLIQRADPPGVGARTPQESLLVQLDSLTDSIPPAMLSLAQLILQNHFELLGKRDYAQIARRLRVPRTWWMPRPSNASDLIRPAFWRCSPTRMRSAFSDPDINSFQPVFGRPAMVGSFTPFPAGCESPRLAALADATKPTVKPPPSSRPLVTKCLQQQPHHAPPAQIIAENNGFHPAATATPPPTAPGREGPRRHESTISRPPEVYRPAQWPPGASQISTAVRCATASADWWTEVDPHRRRNCRPACEGSTRLRRQISQHAGHPARQRPRLSGQDKPRPPARPRSPAS